MTDDSNEATDHSDRIMFGRRNGTWTLHHVGNDLWQPLGQFYSNPASARTLAKWESMGWTITRVPEAQPGTPDLMAVLKASVMAAQARRRAIANKAEQEKS